MKIRIFTLMMAFLATLSGEVWGQSPIDITNHNGVYVIDGDNPVHLTGTSTFGIRIENGYKGTVTLENVTINVDGTAIVIDGQADLTILLKGNNVINNKDYDEAISVPHDASTSLTFDANSTGSLTINMEGTSHYAIGEDGTCGDITINGGTIITNGKIGQFVDKNLTIGQNAVVVCEGFDETWHPINSHINREGGIIFENSTTGQMYGDVELKSPLDLTNNSQTAIVNTNGHTLTLASGYTLKCDAENDITGGGTVKAYRVSYDYGQLEGCSAQEGQLPTDYNRYGPLTEVTLSTNELTCSTDQDAFVGWMASTGSSVSSTITTDAATPAGTTITYMKGAWIRKALTLSAMAGEAGKTAKFVMSEGLAASAVKTGDTDLPTGITYADLTFTTLASTVAGTNQVTYNVTPTDGLNAVAVTVTFNIQGEATEITEDDVKVKTDAERTFTYSGKPHTVVSVTITNNGVSVPLEEGTDKDFVATYNYWKPGVETTGTPTTSNVTSVKDAGTYKLLSVKGTGTSGAQSGYYGEISYEDDNILITVNQKEVTVSAIAQTIEVGGSFKTEPIVVGSGSQNPTISTIVTGISGETAALEGALTITAKTTVPGEYSNAITQGTVSFKDNDKFLAKNYKMIFKAGKAIVKRTIDSDDTDDIVLEIDGAETEDGKYIYNGVDYADVQEIKVKIKLSDGTFQTINPDEYNGTIAWKDENEEEVDGVKNVGVYKALITFYSDIYGSATVSKTIEITQRSLTVNLTEVPATIPNDVNLANLESWWSPWDEVSYVNVVEPEKPEFAYDAISLIDKNGNKIERLTDGAIVKVKLEGLALEDGEEGFLKMNYTPIWMYGGTEVDVEADGSVILPPTDGDDEDDNTGIEVVDPDDSGNSGSGITTKRYQLYLANKDYTFPDAKEDYAAEGLELFSRHNKKYTPAGSSFTVWYEHNGVANDGGYRIFIRRGRTGDYQEVKFDEVSKYYQIRNVQSDIYVKIYAADGFPVGNEEISAADYRAYAQPNKIVVITPQPTDVQIISMAGAVVATDKVTGQREFANLTEGVYIVRMGETVVKLQVRK